MVFMFNGLKIQGIWLGFWGCAVTPLLELAFGGRSPPNFY